MKRIPDINNYKDRFDIEFQYQEGDATYSVTEKKRSLQIQIDKLTQDISATKPNSEKLEIQQAVLRKLQRESEKNSSEIEVAIISLSDVDSKITTLKNELDKYQQLRRLQQVGSSIDAELDTKTCPICESDLYDTFGNRTVKREPMTLNENIDFLKSQTDFYINIKIRNTESLSTLQSKSKLIKARIEKEENNLDNLREDLDDINGTTKALLRSKIQAEIELREAKKLESSLIEFKEQASRIFSTWGQATKSLKHLRKSSRNINRSAAIKELLSLLKDNLTAFNFSPASIGSIAVSDQTLRPEQEGYDIVAETSASDYIRIIWSYTLSLLQLAGQKDHILHGGFIVFDEPRQHEASHVSFTSLIEKATEASTYNGQVIFATSLKKNELEEACINKNVNLLCFDDYILRLEKEESITSDY